MSAPVTQRAGIQIGGIGPTSGSGTVERPLQPATPLTIDGDPATTPGTNLWTIESQGATYDGFNTTIITGVKSVAGSAGGIILVQHFGCRAYVNGAGRVTKVGPIVKVLEISVTATVTASASIP